MIHFFNTSTALVVVAFFALISCVSTSDNISPSYGEGTAIFLRIDQSVFETRAVSSPIPENTPLNFNTGNLFLVTSDGVIMEHFPIVADGGASNPSQILSGNSININHLTSNFGVVIRNLPPSLRNGYAVVVGNTPFTSNAINISDVEEIVIDVLRQSQFHLTSSGYGVNLFGRALLTNPNNDILNGNRLYSSTVTVNPTVARLEITNIVGMGNITSFYVEGVFIDNFYRHAHIDGSITAPRVNNIATGGSFNWNTSTFPSAFHEILFDWHGNSLLSSAPVSITINNEVFDFPAVSPDTSNVWSYHLFARSTYTTPPNIVFRLRDVQVYGEDNPRPNPQFVTISGFVRDDNNAALQGFRAGNIYHIRENTLVFYEGNLRSTPMLPSSGTLSTRVTVK